MADIEKQISDSILQPTERLLELIGLAYTDEAPLRASTGVQGRGAHGTVIVTRAPTAGTDPFTAADVRSPEDRRRVIAQLRKKGRTPDAASGPLGQTARAVAVALGDVEPDDDAWAERLGWTHLYRVGPETGEPSPELRAAQQALGAQIFWREILIWRPRRVLLMTGLDWAAPLVFSNHASELEPAAPEQLVKATGALVLQGAKVPALVVTEPPAGDTPEQDAAQIVAAFESLGMGPDAGDAPKGVTELTFEPGQKD